MTTKGLVKTFIALPTMPVILSPLVFMVSLILIVSFFLFGLFMFSTSMFDKPAIAKISVPEKIVEKIPPKKKVRKIPETIKGATSVDADWIKENNLKREIKLFDVRGRARYIVHIPGAIPYKWRDNKHLKKLPHSKETPIIVYGDASNSLKSYEFTRWLVKMGYKKIYWFRGGFKEWKSKGYTIDDNFS